MYRAGLCQLSSLSGATFSGCGASRLSSFQNTQRDGCPAPVVKAPCSGGKVVGTCEIESEGSSGVRRGRGNIVLLMGHS